MSSQINCLDLFLKFCVIFCAYGEQFYLGLMNQQPNYSQSNSQNQIAFQLLKHDSSSVRQPQFVINPLQPQVYQVQASVSQQPNLLTNCNYVYTSNPPSAPVTVEKCGQLQQYSFYQHELSPRSCPGNFVRCKHANQPTPLSSFSTRFQHPGCLRTHNLLQNSGQVSSKNTVNQPVVLTQFYPAQSQESNDFNQNLMESFSLNATKFISRPIIFSDQSNQHHVTQSVEGTLKPEFRYSLNFLIFQPEFIKKHKANFALLLDYKEPKFVAPKNCFDIYLERMSPSKPLIFDQQKDRFLRKLIDCLKNDQIRMRAENQVLSIEELTSVVCDELNNDLFKVGTFLLYVCFNTRGFKNLMNEIENESHLTMLHSFRGGRPFSVECLLKSAKEWDSFEFRCTTLSEAYTDMLTIGRLFLLSDRCPKDNSFTWSYKHHFFLWT